MENNETEVLPTPSEAREQLWRMGNLSWLLDSNQLQLKQNYLTSPSRTLVWAASRRLGKCRAQGTTVLTPNGPVEIQNIKIGDKVYGYNNDGSISLTTVINTIDCGEKEVFELTNNNRVLDISSKDHVYLTETRNSKKIYTRQEKVEDFKNRKKSVSIVRKFVDVPCGKINEPHAYVIGALLGDGCSRQGKKIICISSESDDIPKKLAEIIGCGYYRNSEKNYTYCLSYESARKGPNRKEVHVNYYKEWIKGRYAHEKIIDWDIVNNWDRNSSLALLAGLIDTDGSVGVNGGILTIQFGSQSMSLINAFNNLFFKLFQYKPTIIRDKRDKYKNGPFFSVSIRNNLFTKRAIRELNVFLQKNKKKWKSEYENLNENNTAKGMVGVKVGKSYKKHCYDITVNNENSLYLTGEGLVTHNSYTLCVLAIEMCLSKKNAIVKYLASTQKDVREIIRPLMRELIASAPDDIRPVEKKAEGIWYFPSTGSQIKIVGCDGGRADSARGSNSDLCLMDEAGFVDDLKYIVRSVLKPTMILTKGKLILASTPPMSPSHEFVVFMNQAILDGSFTRKTIFDNPRLTAEDIKEIAEEDCDGMNTVDFKREYMAQVVVDKDTAIVPEFEEAEIDIVREWKKPAFYNAYVSMDVGAKDLTVVLFGYHDFVSNKLIIEDEYVITGKEFTTDVLAREIKAKEKILFRDEFTYESKEPYKRVSDNNLILINDLHRLHGILFRPTRKDDADAALNNVRVLIANKQIIINPRCKILISHLKAGIWDKNKTKFARSAIKFGHFDAIDSLKYMVRNVNFQANPFPARHSNITGPHAFYTNGHQGLNSKEEMFNRMLNIKKKN